MNFYFMPRVEGFDTSITLVNFASMNDHLKGDGLRPQQVHVCWSDGKLWQNRLIDQIEIEQSRTYKLDDLPHEVPITASPFLYCHPDSQPKQSLTLAVGSHMTTMPNWRGNIRLESEQAFSSYQGEFPDNMTKAPKGSFVSINPMMQQEPGLHNKLLFVNIQVNPAIEAHEMMIANMASKQVLSRQIVYTNSVSMVDLDAFEGTPQDLMVLGCGTMLGIPIYLSYTTAKDEISLEHTHPPVSTILFGNSLSFQRNMKAFWLKELL